jgi:lysophospholipase L1-like esterase
MSTVLPASTGRALLIRGLAGVFGLILGLGLAELGLRLYAVVGGAPGRRLASRDPLGAIYEPYGNSGYRPTPGKTERFPNGTAAHYNRMAYRGPVVSETKPVGVYRIVLLGGSTTVGYGADDDGTIDAHMRTLLRSGRPGNCAEVVNLGLGGYDSYQDYERLRVDGLRLSPDAVVIHSGINDVRNAQYPNLRDPPDTRTLIWEGPMRLMREIRERGADPWTLAKHYFLLPRLPGFALELWHQREDLHVIKVLEPYDSAVQYYETNLRRTIELALQSGAAVLLSRPPSGIPLRNKPTDPVEKSYWIKDAGTTETYREKLAAVMMRLAQEYQAKGQQVRYVTHTLPLDEYLDDAHLTAAGNATVARGLVEALAPFLPPAGATPACASH